MDDQIDPLGGQAEPGDNAELVFSPRELEMIAEGEASAAEFGTIPAEEVHAWLESMFTSSPLPQPEPRKQ